MANYFTSTSSAKFTANGREVVLFSPGDAMSALPSFAATSVVQREAILGEAWVRQRTREGASIKMTAAVMMDFETRSAAEVWMSQLQEFVTINPVGLLTFATGYMADGSTPSLTRVYHASLIVTPIPITAESQRGGDVVWAGMSLEATLSGDGMTEVPTYATQSWVTDQIAALNKSLAGTYATKDDLTNAAYTLPIASPTVLGGIKGSDSITIDADGTAHSAGGGGGSSMQFFNGTISIAANGYGSPSLPTGYRMAKGQWSMYGPADCELVPQGFDKPYITITGEGGSILGGSQTPTRAIFGWLLDNVSETSFAFWNKATTPVTVEFVCYIEPIPAS